MLKKKSKKEKSINNWEIKKTVHGPAIVYNNEIFFLEQSRQIFDIIDDNPDILFALNKEVIDHLKSNMNPLIEALEERSQQDAMPTIISINAIHNYFRFVYHEYKEYRAAIARAVLGSSEVEAVYVLNPKAVNEFYNLDKEINKEIVDKYLEMYNESK
jgi:hypothetical protein